MRALATLALTVSLAPPAPGAERVAHQLPVSMSTKPDFSDYVDSQGVSRPRPRLDVPLPP